MARKSRKNMMPQAAVQEAVQQNEKELLRTAAYARLSVENGGHETEDSLHTQILQIHNYIRENPELTLTDTYADNGFTGTRFDRPEFERMMQDIRTGKIQCIVVKDLSRFGRDYIETGSYLETIFPIRPCDKNNPNAIRWGRLKEGRWCASTLGCRGLAKTLFDIMEWDEDLRYRFRGQFLEQGDNKMMLFAFDEPEMIKVEEIVLPPKENTEEDEGETVKKKIYIFPPEWAGTFGQPITSIAQVGILRQEHYAGNWDVFRPATEIEEMNIFTAESLNELLREAEKIMEGWTDYR